jgi:hypothetical protein
MNKKNNKKINMTTNDFFKNTKIPHISKINKNNHSKNEDNKINDNLISQNILLFNKSNLTKRSQRLFSTRNPKVSNKFNKIIQSASVNTPKTKINKNIYNSTVIKKDKMSNTGISNRSYRRDNNKLNNRNYSAYYIKSDVPLEPTFISDILAKNNKKRYFSSKISEIEEKIGKLGKSLKLFHSKNKQLNLNKSFINLSSSKNNNNILDSRNSMNNNEEEKNELEKEKGEEIFPDYLKNEFKIKGTNIISPFCLKSRDSFTLQKFIREFNNKSNLKSDKKCINNKLNIFYAQNEEAYNMKLTLLNKKLIEQGKIDKYKIGFSPSEQLLRDIEKKVTFMKKIVEYAYPNTTLMRLRIPESKRYFMKYKYKYEFKKYPIYNEQYDEVHNEIYNYPAKSSRKNSFKIMKKIYKL